MVVSRAPAHPLTTGRGSSRAPTPRRSRGPGVPVRRWVAVVLLTLGLSALSPSAGALNLVASAGSCDPGVGTVASDACGASRPSTRLLSMRVLPGTPEVELSPEEVKRTGKDMSPTGSEVPLNTRIGAVGTLFLGLVALALGVAIGTVFRTARGSGGTVTAGQDAQRSRQPQSEQEVPPLRPSDATVVAVEGLIAIHDMTRDESIRAQAQSSLTQLGVTQIAPEPWEAYQVGSHTIVGAHDAARPQDDLRIAQVVSPGWCGEYGLIRRAQVEVFRYLG